MLSRVAESIYWMNRYIERAENIARFVDVNLHLLLDLPERSEGQWDALVPVSADPEAFKERYGSPDPTAVILLSLTAMASAWGSDARPVL